MGCGTSKAAVRKTAPSDAPVTQSGTPGAPGTPKSDSLGSLPTSPTFGDALAMAQIEAKASTVSQGAVRWMRLSHEVLSGKYASWDNIDLPEEKSKGKDEDIFDPFADEQDDYGTFMSTDHAECDHEVVWSVNLLQKLHKDKTARGGVLRDAKTFGDSLPGLQDRHITVIYNPVGGGGKAKRMVAHMVVPILQLTKLKFTVMPTLYRRHAVKLVKEIDIDSTNGIIVCGGDGLVHEVITGYFAHPEHDRLKEKIHVGITPCGTANAMANALHTHPNRSQISIIGRATLAVAKGQSRNVDVIKCVQENEQSSEELKGSIPVETYALSCVGWGMAGAVALKADKLRWIPGQKSSRYDIAGFVSLISDWPIADKGILEYREYDGSEDGAPWQKKEISLINMLASNLDKQGKKYPILPGVASDDGMVALSYIDSSCSRRRVVQLGLGMKKGKWLALQKGVHTFKCREFKITPTEFKSPFVIDGDPHDVSKIHVQVLNKALSLFYLPAEDDIGSAKTDTLLARKSLIPLDLSARSPVEREPTEIDMSPRASMVQRSMSGNSAGQSPVIPEEDEGTQPSD